MKKRMKRMLVLLMTAALMISMLSVGALAEGEEEAAEAVSEEETEEETALEEDAEAETDAEEAETESEEVLEETSDTEEAADAAALGEAETGDEALVESAEDETDTSYSVTSNDELTNAVSNIAGSESMTGTIVIAADFEISTGITIPSGVDVTITDDGSSRTITVSAYNVIGFTVSESGNLTINGENLTISRAEMTSTDGAYPIVLVQGEAELKSGTITNNNQKLYKGANNATNTKGGVVTVVGSSAKFVMSGGTIKNANSTGMDTGLVVVRSGASFEMSDGTISGFSSTNLYAGAVMIHAYSKDAAFTMTGGTICNNSTKCGGGVQIYAYGSGVTGSFVMNGGTIASNIASTYGGAISFESYSGACASVEINEGTIKDNKSEGGGGAISCGYYSATNDVSLLISGGEITGNTCSSSGGGVSVKGSNVNVEIAGGTISENIAGYMGGGLYLGGDGDVKITGGIIFGNKAGTGGGICVSCEAYIYGGEITGNIATDEDDGEGHGGGIYVGKTGTLYLYNVIVTENTASVLGGGLWACNTGSIELYVNDGGAIYGNDAQGEEGKTSSEAGDDIASITKTASSYILFLANRILGGGSANYYTDGGIDLTKSYTTGYADTLAARYSSDSEEVTSYSATEESYALKNIVLAGSIALAESKAELVISGNSALRGGGIATNGNVVIGSANGETTSVTVTKTWDDSDNIDDIRPESVTVNLYNTVDGTAYLIDTATLSEANGWTCTFNELPVDEDYSYSVAEEVPTGYTAAYSTAENEDGSTSVAITNTHEYVTTSVTVTKTWNDSDDADGVRPDSVTVELYADDEAAGKTLVLSGSNDWFGTFGDLPKYSVSTDENGTVTYTEIVYTVEESEVSGYGVSYSSEVDEENNLIEITVTNTLLGTPSVTKAVSDSADGTYSNSVEVEPGDTVYYEATVTTTAAAHGYVLHDTMSGSLSFGSVTGVYVDGAEVNSGYYTVSTDTSDGCTFEVVISDDYVLGTLDGGETITVRYTAVLSSDAESGTDYPNEIYLEYDDPYYWSMEGTEVPKTTDKSVAYVSCPEETSSTTTTTTTSSATGALGIIKVDAATGARLAGATFALYNDTEGTLVGYYTTDSNGYLQTSQLTLNYTYSFVEVTAPEGYVLDSTAHSVTLTSDLSSSSSSPYVLTISNTAEASVLAEEREIEAESEEAGEVLGTERGSGTGDTSNLLLWILLLIAAGAGLGAAVIYFRFIPKSQRRF